MPSSVEENATATKRVQVAPSEKDVEKVGPGSGEWQPQGYLKLADMMGPRKDYAIFRKFGSLGMLSLLSLQAQLVNLDAEYREICRRNDKSEGIGLNGLSSNFYKLEISYEGDDDGQREKLKEIRETVGEYYKLLLRFSKVASLETPEREKLEFLNEWLEHEEGGDDFLQSYERRTWTLGEKDTDRILGKRNRDEFVTMAQPDENRSAFGKLVRPKVRSLCHRSPLLRKLAQPKPLDGSSPNVLEYGDSPFLKTVDYLVKALGVFFASMWPIVAIFVLYYVHPIVKRLGIAVAFTAGFSLALAIFTAASTKELFGATAAFAAVEVVFIGSVNGNGTDSGASSNFTIGP